MTTDDRIVAWLRPRLRVPLERFRKRLSRSSTATRWALLLRNQIDGVVFLHFGHDTEFKTNGEEWLLDRVAAGASTFVDVGANAGDWSALFLERAPNASGLLFDPSTSAYERLATRFADNRSITILREAVSDGAGQVTFYEEANVGPTSSLVAGFSKGARCVTVQSTTLDDTLQRQGLSNVDFLKIDAEGFDLHVLRGAAQSLEAHRIRLLQFEYNEIWRGSGSTLKAALSLLDHAGYAVFLLKGPGLYRLPNATCPEYYHDSNFAAFPRERLAELNDLVVGEI